MLLYAECCGHGRQTTVVWGSSDAGYTDLTPDLDILPECRDPATSDVSVVHA